MQPSATDRALTVRRLAREQLKIAAAYIRNGRESDARWHAARAADCYAASRDLMRSNAFATVPQYAWRGF